METARHTHDPFGNSNWAVFDDSQKAFQLSQALIAIFAFVIGAAGILFLFGPTWSGIAAMVVVLLGVSVFYNLRLGSDPDPPDELPPAGTKCPHCGAHRTDHEMRFAEDGTEYEQLHCFSCERDLSHENLQSSEARTN